MDLVLVAAGVMVLAVVMYVILDGFDLGIGILFPFVPEDSLRDAMLDTIAAFWDGNETWLVLGGVTLFAAFPLAYTILLPAWYVGIMLFLAALLFRGVVFEFRSHSQRKWIWNTAISAGSTLAAFAQGSVLGSFIQGVEVREGYFAGGPFDWLTPFSVMTGLALVCGYALLGATWLILKSEGTLQAWAFRVARPLLLGMLGFIVLVSLWSPFLDPDIARRWFSWPNLALLSPVPIVTAWVAGILWRRLDSRDEHWPFPLTVGLFMLSFLGLGVSLWPYVVPRHLTLWQAASSPPTLAFLLSGEVILLPLVLAYTVNTYRVFRGKARPGQGYR